MRGKSWKKLLLVGVVFLFVVASGQVAYSQTKLVQITGATSGGTYFLLANAIAQLLNHEMPNVRASAQSTAGSPVELRLIHNKEADFGVVQAGVAYDAFNGLGSFEGKPLTNFRSVTYLYPNVMQVPVRKDANIKSFADFKGKRFCVGAVGSATELNSRHMAQVYGMDYQERKDFIPEYTSEAQSVELLKNRQAVGANMIAAQGSSTMMDLMSTGEFEILEFPPDVVKKLQEISPPYFPYTIPANTYPNQPEPVQTFAVANWFVCRADLEEDFVYQVVKLIYENVDYLVKIHKVAENIKPENALNGQTVELHPGAAKYFKEIGVLK
ncbi:MAG TPA: TAXI family TRAP transporter solute-binding subunit [Thermosynergistes sp.]|nr:TAXI family TRAP transporter solute-binding subunit [Thermosynergistes sp.]